MSAITVVVIGFVINTSTVSTSPHTHEQSVGSTVRVALTRTAGVYPLRHCHFSGRRRCKHSDAGATLDVPGLNKSPCSHVLTHVEQKFISDSKLSYDYGDRFSN